MLPLLPSFLLSLFFFFNDTATTEIYTLSLHDALPISPAPTRARTSRSRTVRWVRKAGTSGRTDRKSTRRNSSHGSIEYAVFCLKKKIKADPGRVNRKHGQVCFKRIGNDYLA